jgi:hypothetical protein
MTRGLEAQFAGRVCRAGSPVRGPPMCARGFAFVSLRFFFSFVTLGSRAADAHVFFFSEFFACHRWSPPFNLCTICVYMMVETALLASSLDATPRWRLTGVVVLILCYFLSNKASCPVFATFVWSTQPPALHVNVSHFNLVGSRFVYQLLNTFAPLFSQFGYWKYCDFIFYWYFFSNSFVY